MYRPGVPVQVLPRCEQNGQTGAKNITLPQTSFAGGNKFEHVGRGTGADGPCMVGEDGRGEVAGVEG